MKKLTATFFTAFLISGAIAALILFLLNFPLKEAIFTGTFAGLGTGIALVIMTRKSRRSLEV
jgi:hypothetical protein